MKTLKYLPLAPAALLFATNAHAQSSVFISEKMPQ